ncbi:hypothetical protein [Acinetobacter shaoyimingii]|uniref:Uncharacterized protein n=1 Tax=Acinetobacter shaoyimingii TaxID=2715164 RepID=A0A6G8RXA7_9GAMM|nr:hypothetical protein [Acinetobacter shaoyimingii]QIO06438.1 hypothetical protein G8E00_10970 [Acinetobacter shaoyimingii]
MKLIIDGSTQTITSSTESRESLSKKIYFSGLSVFKIISRTQGSVVKSLINRAKTEQIPIANESRCYDVTKVTVQEDDKTTKDYTNVCIYQSERHIGEFFQLSKPGGFSKIETFKRNNPQHKDAIDRALKAAERIGMTDIQGFLCQEKGMPIRFIDPHWRTSS